MRIIISVCLCNYVFVSFTLDARGQGTSEWETMNRHHEKRKTVSVESIKVSP